VAAISVVIITCDGARWVEAQIRSIVEQTRPPDEVVISDDASLDDTLAVVERALAPLGDRARVVRGGPRRGVTANLERAIHASSGDLIVLADQDDTWLPHKLASLEDWASSSSAGAVFSDGWIIDAEGKRTGERLWARTGLARRRLAILPADPLSVLLRQPAVTGATLALRRATLDLLLPIPVHGWHDYAMSLLLAATSGLDAITDPLIEYRLHGANTAGLAIGSRRQRIQSADAHRDHLRTQTLLFEDLVDRLDPFADLDARRRFVAKSNVLRRRAALPRARPRRVPGVAGLVLGGGYQRYAQGFSSAARDLFWE